MEPRFAYIAPYYAQAKDVAWQYLKRFSAAVPGVEFNESELRADYPNGGRVKLYGADNYDRMRGIYLDGSVLDEYGLMDPRAFTEVIRPALSDRKGWADFIGTANGRNHFYELYRENKENPDWFVRLLKASETGLILPEELADARRSMSQEQYDQEYECSFNAAVIGAYYGKEMAAAEADKRIGRVPYEPRVQVETWWDLGVGDATAIWFCQRVNAEIRLIDYVEATGQGLAFYIKTLRERPYIYSRHIAPHDIEHRELGSGRTRIEMARELGIEFVVAPKLPVDDGINAVRAILPRCWFDADKCKRGVQALTNYRAEFDAKRDAVKSFPLHDWASHGSDAFRYGAVTADPVKKITKLAYTNKGII